MDSFQVIGVCIIIVRTSAIICSLGVSCQLCNKETRRFCISESMEIDIHYVRTQE